MMKLNEMTVVKKNGRPRSRPDDEIILKLYKNMTSTQIGMMFDVSPATVRSWVMRAKQSQDVKDVD